MESVIEATAEPLHKLLKHLILLKYEPARMNESDLKEYAEKIKRDDLHEDVVLLDDRVLTHCDYYNACISYGIPVEPRIFGSHLDDGPDPAGFVARVYSKQVPGSEQAASSVEVEAETEEDEVSEDEEVEDKPKKKGKSIKDKHVLAMLDLAADEGIQFFCNSKGEAYAKMFVNGHHYEVWPIKSSTFKRKMQRLYRKKTRDVIDATSMNTVLDHFGAMADDNDVQEVYIRQAHYEGDIYIDLGNDSWNAVRIAGDGSGWSIVGDSPVAFIRPKGMLPLPRPEEGGSLNMLREFVAVDDDAFVEVLIWLLGAYHPTGPYTALLAHGQAGSGKSTIGFVLRSLIDPNSCMLRGGGETEEKIVLQAHNGRVVMLDNLSNISAGVSDTLCRILSGSGFSTRRFHTNEEEVLFTETCPVLITSIGRLITRDDLLDRTLMVETHRLETYRKVDKFKEEFGRAQPKILDALFRSVSTALANMDKTEETSQYRMSDFYLWAIAGEQALGLEPGTVKRVYGETITDASQLVLEASPVAQAIITYLHPKEKWAKHAPHEIAGTAAELCQTLGSEQDTQTPQSLIKRKSNLLGPAFADRRDWPANPTQFGNRLRTVESALRTIGIEVTHRRTHGGERIIKIVDTLYQPEAKKEAT